MSDSKWLINRGVLSKYTNNRFNSKIRLDKNGVMQLADELIDPNILNPKYLFEKPSEWLSSLTFYPFEVNANNTSLINHQSHLEVGHVELKVLGSKVSVENSYFNLGQFYYGSKFNNFADYNGYTNVSVFLPYFGFVELTPNDIINKYIQFRLRVDYNTGQGIYYIGVSDTAKQTYLNSVYNDGDVRIISTHTFQLGVNLPLGSSNNIDIMRNTVMSAIKIGGTIAATYAIGAGGFAVGTTTHSTVTKAGIKQTARNAATGRQITTGTMTGAKEEFTRDEYDRSNFYKARATSDCFNTATEALANIHFKPSSDIPNNSQLMIDAPNSIYIVIKRPKINEADANYRKIYGAPLGEVRKLNSVYGLTEISDVHFEGVNGATFEEIEMLYSAFSEPIIFPDKPPVIINFYVGNVAYSAFKGNTWRDFIENGQGDTFEIDSNDRVVKNGDIVHYNNSVVYASNIIIDGARYTLITPIHPISFTVDNVQYAAYSDTTWGNFVSQYPDEFTIVGSHVANADGDFIYYNHNKVSTNSLIVENGYYTTIVPEVITFYVDNVAYNCIEGDTWIDWITNGQGDNFSYNDINVFNPYDRMIVYRVGTEVIPTDMILSNFRYETV